MSAHLSRTEAVLIRPYQVMASVTKSLLLSYFEQMIRTNKESRGLHAFTVCASAVAQATTDRQRGCCCSSRAPAVPSSSLASLHLPSSLAPVRLSLRLS